jgi:hypothetical protein
MIYLGLAWALVFASGYYFLWQAWRDAQKRGE